MSGKGMHKAMVRPAFLSPAVCLTRFCFPSFAALIAFLRRWLAVHSPTARLKANNSILKTKTEDHERKKKIKDRRKSVLESCGKKRRQRRSWPQGLRVRGSGARGRGQCRPRSHTPPRDWPETGNVVNKKWTALQLRNGLNFSKEGWNFWQKWPHSSAEGMAPQKTMGKASQEHMDMASLKNMGMEPLKSMGMVPQNTLDRESQIWEKPLLQHSFHQMAQSKVKNRLWQPPHGSREPFNGKVCHGMDPCWVISNSAGLQQTRIQEPFYKGLRRQAHWWARNTKNPEVLRIIQQGVQADHPLPSKLSKVPCMRSQEETKMAWETVQEYLEVGALTEISWHQAKHLIPWFVIKKGGKLRLITNCKEINHYLEPKPFRLENWPEIFPFLRKGMWAAKIDLKHAYFHLGIAEELKPYICIQVEQKVFQFQEACFDMSTLPQQW